MPRPVLKPNYSPHKRTQIITEYNLGQSAKVVALKYGCPPASVYKIAKRAQGQISCRSRRKSGRPPALSEADKIAIRRCASLDPFIQTRALKDQAGVAACGETIRQFLAKEGIHHKWAMRRPFITQEHADARLEFARRWGDKPAEFWDDWIFSDETSVDLASGQRKQKVWCPTVSFLPFLPTSIFLGN